MAGAEENEIITTIILINRSAELVDINFEGEVVKRHAGVPDYFSSRKSHQTHLLNSLKQLSDAGDNDYFLPQSSTRPNSCLQAYMIAAASYQNCQYDIAPQLSTSDKGIASSIDYITIDSEDQYYTQMYFIRPRKNSDLLKEMIALSSEINSSNVLEALNESSMKYKEPLRRRIV